MAHEHHDHDHSSTPLRALLIALGITGTVFFAELIGGWLAGSMALMADAMHMLSDAAGLIIAVLAVLVGRRQASAQATYGYRRVEVLAALANAVMVLAISVWIVVEAVRRLQSPAEVQGKTMLIIAVIGLVANALSAWVLHRHRKSSINVEGAFLHVLVDMLCRSNRGRHRGTDHGVCGGGRDRLPSDRGDGAAARLAAHAAFDERAARASPGGLRRQCDRARAAAGRGRC